jgi:uncharacterized protein with HEPN domain
MRRDPRSFLWDIQQAADAIASFTAGLDAETFAATDMIHTAVERKFEIIGEALSQLAETDQLLAERIPDFRRAVSFRNLLIHGYAIVDLDRVWRSVAVDLPRLRAAVAALLDELGPP